MTYDKRIWLGTVEKSETYAGIGSVEQRPLSFKGLREIEWVNFGGGSAKNLCIG